MQNITANPGEIVNETYGYNHKLVTENNEIDDFRNSMKEHRQIKQNCNEKNRYEGRSQYHGNFQNGPRKFNRNNNGVGNRNALSSSPPRKQNRTVLLKILTCSMYRSGVQIIIGVGEYRKIIL